MYPMVRLQVVDCIQSSSPITMLFTIKCRKLKYWHFITASPLQFLSIFDPYRNIVWFNPISGGVENIR